LALSGTSGDGSGTGVAAVYYLVDDASADHSADVATWNATKGAAAPVSGTSALWKATAGLVSAWTGTASMATESGQRLWVVAADKGGNTTTLKLVQSGNFVTGKTYTIETLGTTDFTTIGAASNTVGLSFTATGGGSGTGKAWIGSGQLVPFGRDASPPNLTVNAVPTVVNAANAASFTGLSGTAYDTNPAAFPIVTVETVKNGGAPSTAVAAYSPAPTSYSSGNAWSLPFAVDTSGHTTDGSYSFTVTATDAAGKTAVQTFAVNIDTRAPTETITQPGTYLPSNSLYWLSGSTATFSGTAADAGGTSFNLVSAVYYKVDVQGASHASDDPTTWTLAAGTANWTSTVALGSLGEGKFTLWVAALDTAGNKSAFLQRDFGVDQAVPTVSTTGVPAFTKAAFAAAGTVGDTNALASMTVEQRKDGGAWVTVLSQAETGTSQSWTTGSTLPRDPASPGTPLLADGTYDYRVTVTDVAAKTAVTTTTVQIDSTPPTVSVSSPTASQWLSGTAFQASGSASDPGSGSGLASVEYSLDGGTTWNTATGTGSWTANLNLTSLGEGTKTMLVRATDKAGNVSNPAASTVSFGIDQAPPTLTETTSGIASSALVYKNAAVTIGGAANDANGVPHVVVTYQKDGGSAVTLVNDTNDDGVWTATLPFAADHSLDGTYDVTVTATDGAGKTSTVSRRVQLDTQSPTLSITAPVASEIVPSNSYTIRGQVTDNGGKGVSTLQYSTDGTTWNNITLSGLNWSVANVNFAGASEGARTLYVRADDGLNPATQVSVAFNYDTAPPVLSEALGTSSQVIRSSTFILSGTASDTNSLASVAITATKDGTSQGTVYSQTFAGSAPQPYSFSQIVHSNGSDDGTWVYTVTATDVAGRTTVLTRTVLVDATPPALPVIGALSSPYYDVSLPVSGSASDTGSGVQTMEYSFDNATWSTLTGTDSWFATIILSSSLPTLSTDGIKTLYVRATDRAGNQRVQTATFRYDTAAPAVTENAYSAATVTSNTGVSFNGAAQDFNGGTLATAFVHVTVNGTAQPDIPVTANAWNWTYPNTTEGPAAIVFSVIDAAGRTASVTRNVLIDKTPPTVAIGSPSAGDVISGTSVTIAGTAADTGSGLATGGVEYSLDGTTWSPVDGTANWNKTITTSGEGAKTLSVRAHDNVGLVSSTATVTFNVDLNPPTLAETTLGGNVKKNTAFSLGGTAGDTNGLATWDNDSNPLTPPVPYVTVSVNGGAATKVVVTSGNWTFPYTPSADGTVDFTVTATDVVGKTTSVTREVTVDTTPPTISVDGVLTGLNVSTNQVNGVMTFRFSADDAGVGLEKNGSSQYLAYYTIVPHGSPDLSGTTAVTAWTAVAPSASPVFTFAFDTTTAATPDGQYDLYLAVRDAVPGTPNVKVVKYSSILDINQDSDRPIITFNNLNVSAIHNIDNTFGKDPVLLLTIQDDDKVKVSDLQYRIDIDNDGQFTSTKDFWNGQLVNGTNSMTPDGNTNSKWEDESVWYNFDVVPSSDGSLVQAKINLTGFPQGLYGIQVRARDNTDASTWTTIFGNNANHTWQKSGIVPFAVDFGPPALAVTSPTAGVFRNALTLTGTTSDPLGVASVRYTFDGTNYTTVYANATPLDPIPVASLVPGVKYTVTTLGNTDWSAVGAGASPALGTSFTATAAGTGSGYAKVDPTGVIPFSAAVDLSALGTGDWSLQVVSTDVTGAAATQTLTVSVDKDGPSVSVSQPAASSTLNGTAVTVSGQASDNRKVGAVFVWSGLTTAPNPALPAQTALPSVPNPNGLYNPGGYTQVSGTSVWSTTIDTTSQVLTAANGYRVRVVAVDAVGNVGTPVDVPVTVDQQTDRPVISFSNLSLVSPSRLPAGNLTIIGTVTDDDAVNHTSIQIRLDRNGDGDYNDAGEGWVDISTPPAADGGVVSWSHTITDMTSQGNRHVQVRVRDVNAPAYGTDANFDASLATTYGWTESPSVAFYIDNGPPALDLTGPTIGQKFNAGQFTLTGSSTDTNGLQKITVWVDDNDNQVHDPGETTTLTGPNVNANAMVTGFTYTIATVNGTDFTTVGAPNNNVGTTFVANGPAAGSGTLTNTPLTYDETTYNINAVIATFSNTTKPVKAVQVTSYDQSGASTERDLSIVYDPVPPTVTFNSPADASTVNGTIKISGLADDNYQLSKVFYNVSPAAASPVFPTDYTELTGQTYSWNVNVPTLPLPDGAYKVRVVAQDSSQNNSTAPAVLNLTVNQASDRPVISVLTLNPSGTAVQNLLPASLQISGTVADDDAVDHTRIQIRTHLLPSGAWSAWTNISGPPTSDVALATWNHTFTGLTDGQYELQIRSADTLSPAYGTDANFDSTLATTWGWNESAPIPFAVDLNLPTGTILTPAQSSSQNTDVVISGNASDASGIKKVSIAFDTGSGYGAETVLTTTNIAPIAGNPAVSWTTTYSVGSAADGQIFYRVTISDAFDKVRTYEQYFTLDKTVPTVGFDSTAANPDTTTGAYNGTVTFRGHADDNIKLSKIYYQFNASDPGAPDASFTGWTQASNTYTWTAALDTTTVNSGGTDVSDKLWVVAVDGAGNASARQNLAFVINQSSDKPVITLTAPTSGQTFDVNAKALGTVTDDDGLASVQVRIVPSTGTFAADGSDYVAVSSPATVSGKSISLEHVLSTLADGDYKLQFRARDVNFTSTAATPNNETVTAVIPFSIDTTPPTVTLNKITVTDPYGGADRNITSNFNGSYVNNDLTLTLQASDASGVAAVEVNAGTSWTAATLASGNYTFNLHIPRDQSFDGAKNIQYRATDNHGKVTSAIVTLIVDTLEPVIGFTSPTSMHKTDSPTVVDSVDAPNVNGIVTVLGTVSDSSALASVTITGGKNAQPLTNLGNNLGWKVSFDSNLYANSTASFDQGSNIWRFPITITATDMAGNRTQTQTTGWIDIDPNSDNPIITVASPSDGGSVSGSFLINGTVTDDDGAKEVRLQIDLNDDGVFGANGGFPGYLDLNGDGNHTGDFEDETVVKTIPVTNGAWSILMNQASELNKSNLVARGLSSATGFIRFKATPVDINNLAGTPQTERIYIDSSAPVISGLAADGVTAGPDITPITGSLQKGTITVHALFKDDQSIPAANMQVSLDGGSNFVAVSSVAGATISGDVGSGNPYTYRIAIPVNTATAVAGGNGDLQISLKVTDQTFKQTTSSLTYHVDNTLPTTAWDTPAQLTNVSGGIYSFSGSSTSGAGNITANMVYGQAIDSGTISGVDHIDVYFVKNGNQLYDPKNGGFTTATNSVSGDLLYNQGGTVATGVPFTQDAWTSANAADPHHYAIRIDKRTELGQFDTNPSLGDGDGFQESLKAKSGYDEWYAYFNSTKLPDGPMTTYFVAYDQAGNKRYGTASSQIANYPPSITQVSVNGGALTASPYKFKNVKATGVPFVITAADSNVSPVATQVSTTGWSLQVLDEWGNATDVGASTTNTFTNWNYSTSGTTNWTGTFTIDLTNASFRAGYWYRFRATTTDMDGNVAIQDFYVRTITSDTSKPTITMNPIDQTAVSGWTTKTTPLSLDIAAGNLSNGSSTISKTLPSWITAGTQVMWAGVNVPAGFSQNTVYYVTSVTGSTFALAATSGGSAISVAGAPSGTYWLVSGGHVEPAASAAWNQGTMGSARAAVSGALKLSGTVSDDSDVQSLTIAFNGAAADTVTLTNKTGNAVTGYSYNWSYEWDTSRITAGGNNVVAQSNVAISLVATDTASNVQNTLSGGNIAVDVAPYITSMTDGTGLPAAVLRGATGAYSITKSTNTLNVYGYNLGRSGYAPTAWSGLAATSYVAGGNTANAVPTPDSTYPVNLITVTKNWSRSGYLTVTVNSVPSVNNLDTNSSNSESTTNPTTAKWTDDRFLWVWATTQIVPTSLANTSVNPSLMTYYNPTMVVNPTGDQPEFAFNDDNGGVTGYTNSNSQATIKTGYRKMGQAALATATIGGTYQRFFASGFDSQYNSGDNTGMLEVMGWNTGQITTNSFGQSYGPSVFTDGGVKWVPIEGNDFLAPWYSTTGGAYRFVNRFPHPQLVAKASTVNAGWANIYLAYYDSSPYAQNLNFVSFAYSNAQTNTGGILTYETSNTTQIGNGTGRNTSVMVIPGTDSGHGSSSFSMAQVGTSGVAVAYYDPVDAKLKLATSPAAFTSGGTAGTGGTDNKTNLAANTVQTSVVTITATTTASVNGKSFTVYDGTTPWTIAFDNTVANTASYITGNTLTVGLSGVTNAATNISIALSTALGATIGSPFRDTPIATTAATTITAVAPGASTAPSLGSMTGLITLGTTTAGTSNWTTTILDSSAGSGNYVSLTSDGTNLYMAYQDTSNGQLKFTLVPWNGTGTPGAVQTVIIDGQPSVPISVGSWTKVMMLNLNTVTGQNKLEPVIAYYADSYGGSKNSIRFAVPKFDATASLQAGTSSDNYTGNWDVITVQAVGNPSGGDSRFNQVQLDSYSSSTLPVLGWVTTKPEYAKLQPNN
jgi:hypothetical protein